MGREGGGLRGGAGETQLRPGDRTTKEHIEGHKLEGWSQRPKEGVSERA